MPAFQYRLQKIFELRERKKKEQERRVQQARQRVKDVEEAIEAKKNEIRLVRHNMMVAPHTLMEAHDVYLEKLDEDLDQLFEELKIAQQQLEYEMQMLIKAQAELEALVKHKEKALEEFNEEELRKEMKQMDEVANQRYFRAQQTALEEEQNDKNLST